MKRFEDIVIECIEDIKAGRASIEDCLERHPSLRGQLEPLLKIALAIEELPSVKPSTDFKMKARIRLMDQIHAWKTRKKWPWSRRQNWVAGMQYKRRFGVSMASIILAIVVTLSLVGGGTVYASQASLPGDALYDLKLATEELTIALPAGDIARAERALSFAQRRIREMEALAARGRSQDLSSAAENYGYALNLTLAKMEQARNRGLDAGNVTARVAEATTRHLSVLDRVWDMVPEAAKPAIEHAGNVSQTGYFRALAALAQNNAVRATEINLIGMQGRLDRIRERARDREALQVTLQQFEAMSEFSEVIYRIAQEVGLNVTELEELIAQASGKHLEVLAEVWEKVPDQAKPAIERAMANAMMRYERRVRRIEQGGGVVPPSPRIPDRVRERMEERIREQDASSGGVAPGQSGAGGPWRQNQSGNGRT